MTVICAWCGFTILAPTSPMDERVSHGICWPCYTKELERHVAEKAVEDNPD